MATELEGKPLKFTAVFDSKDADMQISAFLKKIQDLNTKGAGNNASKAVNKASGQYKSILSNVTQTFSEFVTSNERFYSSIARSEMGLQKIRNEQNTLNAELRKGLVTEDEYIKKTTQLTQLREKLSQELRDNKTQLSQYNAVANAKPKFTRQDTLNELASVHRSGGISNSSYSAPELSAMQKEVKQLELSLSELDKKLKEGTISNEQYAKSTESIKSKLQDINDHQNYWNQRSKNFGSTDELEKQKTVLDALSTEYKTMVSEASSAFQAISPDAQKLTTDITAYREENRKLSAAQKELDTAFKDGSITQTQYLEASRNIGIQQNENKRLISQYNKELVRMDAAERQSIGSIAEKTARLTQIKAKYDQLSESQRNNINVGGKLRQEYQHLSDEVGKLNASLTGTKSQGITSIFSSLRGIAGAVGIGFGVHQLVSFGKELFHIARQSEGVTMAFNRMSGDSTRNLQLLRTATKGTVSDLELMKNAVRADNFKIPMDVLAKGLMFAQQRAKDTGQNVDYLVNSFVDGIGRKSKLVLDNLGISAAELSKELEKNGDYAIAAGNIIDREMAKAGAAVDTFGEKTDRLNARWENLKLSTASYFKGLMDSIAELLTSTTFKEFITATQKIGSYMIPNQSVAQAYRTSLDLPEAGSKQKGLSGYNDLKKFRSLEIDKQKESLEIQKRAVNGLVEEYKKNKSNLELRDKMLYQQEIYAKMIAEVGVNSKKRNATLNEESGLITKLEKDIADLTAARKRSEDVSEINDFSKQIESKQKQLDSLLGKSSKQTIKQTKELEKDENSRVSLLDKWAKADADYLNKQLTRDQQEIESVKSKYAEIRKEIEKHNKETKGEKILLDGFDESISTAVNTIKERQSNDSKLKQYEEDYQNYLRYIQLKKETNEEFANEQLGSYKDILDKVNSEITSLGTKRSVQGLSPTDQAYLEGLEKIQSTAQKNAKLKIQESQKELFILMQTYQEKRIKLISDFEENRKIIEKEATAEQLKAFDEKHVEELNALDDANIQKLQVYKNLFEGIEKLSDASSRKVIADAKARLLSEKDMSPELRKQIIEALRSAEESLDNRLYDRTSKVAEEFSRMAGYINNVNQELGDMLSLVSNVLKASVDVGAGFKELTKNLDNYQKNKTDGGGGILGEISAIAGVAGSAGKIVSAVTSVVSGVLTIGKRTKEMNRQARAEVQKFYDEAIRGEMEYQALLRQREIDTVARGKSSYNAIIAQLDALKKQSPEIEKAYNKIFSALQGEEFIEGQGYKHGTWFRKAKTWDIMASLQGADYDRLEKLYSEGRLKDKAKADFEALRALREELESLGLSVEDLQNDLNRLLTGTDATALASGLTDLFASGKRSAADFGESFEEIMHNALKSSFQAKYLNDAMTPFYNELAALMEAGTPNEKQIADLKKKYEDIAEEAGKRWDDIGKITGQDLSSDKASKQGELSKGIAGITENTGNRLEAEFGGLRLAQLELLQVSKSNHADYLRISSDKLGQLIAIQNNTFRTANNTDRLENIETAIVQLNNKITNTDAIRRGAGF